MATPVEEVFYQHATAKRIDTGVLMYDTLKQQYPSLEIVYTDTFSINLVQYIRATGDGNITEISEPAQPPQPSFVSHSQYQPPFPSLYRTTYIPSVNRNAPRPGNLQHIPLLSRYTLTYSSHTFILYQITTRDGASYYPNDLQQYILAPAPQVPLVHELLLRAGNYSNSLHDEIWVFEMGFWQKSAELYSSIQKSRWEDIILPQALKEDLLDTITRFFASKSTYDRLRVPWKRGLIFYGPPGNGKTISIKATMKTLLDLKDPVPTLYVKSLKSFAGSEYSINMIFGLARSQAPCFLVFEDLDSMITDDIRSFFLNAVDGISSNDGVLMVGSTNHLDQLDPGIANRPSRFDRKYEFALPDLKGRTKYAEFWRRKLKASQEDAEEIQDDPTGLTGGGDDIDVEFPHKLCPAIAKLTEGFSFAYMQEAFVSALLAIATDKEGKERASTECAWDLVDVAEELKEIGLEPKDKDDGGDDDEDLGKYLLYREIKKQIKNLRKELGETGRK